jgi:putative oxidoreductase
MVDQVDRKRLYVPAMAPLYERLVPLSATLTRVAMGFIIIPHGFAKLFLDDALPTSRNFVKFGWDHPLAWSYFIGGVEFIGGILLIVGLWTRAAALGFVIEMSVISFAVLWPSWSWGRRGMEYALFMGLISLAIFLRGSGPYALDNLMKKEL